jgi:hypothetical protein
LIVRREENITEFTTNYQLPTINHFQEFKMLVIPPPNLRQKKKPLPAAAASTVQAGLTIVSVIRNGSSSYAITFSSAPTLIAGPVPNSGFAVNGQPPTSLTSPSGNQITANFATTGAGLPWTVSAQPNWLSGPIAFPQSGVTS